jgi:hypothetical protein
VQQPLLLLLLLLLLLWLMLGRHHHHHHLLLLRLQVWCLVLAARSHTPPSCQTLQGWWGWVLTQH